MLRSQILGQKWLMENVKTDAHSITGAWVGGWTDFQNATEASAMGCEVVFPDDSEVQQLIRKKSEANEEYNAALNAALWK